MKKRLSLSLLAATGLLTLTSCGVDLGDQVDSKKFATDATEALANYNAQYERKQIRISHIEINYHTIYESASTGKRDSTYKLNKDVGENLIAWQLSLNADEKIAWNYFASNTLSEGIEISEDEKAKCYEKTNVSFSTVLNKETTIDIDKIYQYEKYDFTDQWNENGHKIYANDRYYMELVQDGVTNKITRVTDFSAKVTYLVSNE